MQNDKFLWVERFRPSTIEECILPKDIKDTFLSLRDKGEIINMLLSGGPGTGKTTVAKALCNELGCEYITVNCSDVTGVDNIRQIATGFGGTVSMDNKVKVVILDEADYLSPNAQAALRNIIESLSNNCRFILTCNFKHRIIEPLHSRTSIVDFTVDKTLTIDMAKRAISILEKEDITYNKLAVAEVVKRFYPDNRRILNELQRYANVSGEIDSGIISVVDTSKVKNLVSFVKSGDFKSCRQWIADNPNPDDLLDDLYKNISEYVTTDSIPNLILIMGEYQHKASFVASQEINLAAFVVEIMKNVKWR